MNTLPTPAMKALPEVNRWLLLEPWGFEVKPDKDNSQNWNGPKIFLVPQGFEWDGASKPFHNSSFFVLPSCHWKLVVPSLEHDFMCDNRKLMAEQGVDSVHAARHFRRQLIRYRVNDDGFNDVWEMYTAVRYGGPQWETYA